MHKPIDYYHAAVEAWRERRLGAFRESLDVASESHSVWDDRRKAAIEQANPPTPERLREAAEQQWNSIKKEREKLYFDISPDQMREHYDYPWTAEQVAVERLSREVDPVLRSAPEAVFAQGRKQTDMPDDMPRTVELKHRAHDLGWHSAQHQIPDLPSDLSRIRR